MENVSLVFTERQNLVAFLRIMKFVFQQLEKEDFYIHSFIRVSTYYYFKAFHSDINYLWPIFGKK